MQKKQTENVIELNSQRNANTLDKSLTSTPAFSSGDLGQIQEILFGSQQRQTHELITQLSNNVAEQMDTLSNVLNSRLGQLADSLETSTQQLNDKLASLENKQSSDVETISDTLARRADTLNKEIASLKQQSDSSLSGIQDALAAAQSELLAKMTASTETVREELQRETKALQDSKLDKQSLAQLLTGVSGQLSE